MTDKASINAKTLAVGVVAPALVLAAVIGPIALAWGDLPDPMNLSWDSSGRPSNPEPASRFLAIQTTAAVLCSAALVAGGFRLWPRRVHNFYSAVLGMALGTTFASISIHTTLANRGVQDWTQATPGPGAAFSIPASLLGFAVIGWLARDLFQSDIPPGTPEPTAGLSLSETQSASWSGQASSRWPVLTATTMMVTGIALTVVGLTSTGGTRIGSGTAIWTGAALVVGGLTSLGFASVQVSVDRHGLTVGYGWLPWPQTYVALDRIEKVAAIDVKPSEHGGWGYRGSRKLFGKAAVVIRRGEGIHLNLADGTQFVVTVDNAAQGAGVLNDLRSKLR